MARQRVHQSSFLRGELNPTIVSRVDLEVVDLPNGVEDPPSFFWFSSSKIAINNPFFYNVIDQLEIRI